MKKIITLAISLLALNAFAVNTNGTWHSRGERLKFVGKQINIGGFESKAAALQGALGMAEELQSGDVSRTAQAKLRNAPTLWDTGDKCASYAGHNMRIVIREMAKGKFEVNTITVGSYFTGNGTEVFSYKMRVYAPCVMKDRD